MKKIAVIVMGISMLFTSQTIKTSNGYGMASGGFEVIAEMAAPYVQTTFTLAAGVYTGYKLSPLFNQFLIDNTTKTLETIGETIITRAHTPFLGKILGKAAGSVAAALIAIKGNHLIMHQREDSKPEINKAKLACGLACVFGSAAALTLLAKSPITEIN